LLTGGTHTTSAVTANKTVAVEYEINTYTIPSSVTSGTGTIDPDEPDPVVNHGSDQTFTITPGTGYHVSALVVDGVPIADLGAAGIVVDDISTPSTYTISNVVDSTRSIAVTFAINTYTVPSSVTSGTGTITPVDPIVNHGSDQVFTITPGTGYHVSALVVDGVPIADLGAAGIVVDDISTPSTYTITNVTDNTRSIAVTFLINTYTITSSVASLPATGTIAPFPTTTLTHGSDKDFTITPTLGYYVKDVVVGGFSIGAGPLLGLYDGGVYTVENVLSDTTIDVTFEIKTFTITTSKTGSGTIDPTIVVDYDTGTDITITPAAGNFLLDVKVGGTSIGIAEVIIVRGSGKYTFSNVIEDKTIEAVFEKNLEVDQTTITIAPGSLNTATVTASGGTPPYFASSGDTNTATVVVNGSNIEITGGLEGGTTITVSDSTATTQNATINVTVTHGDNCATATITGLNSTTQGSIDPQGDWDYFKITTSNSGSLTAYTTGNTDTFGYLLDSSCDVGTALVIDDDNGTDKNFQFNYDLEETTTYYIAIQHYEDQTTGDYTLYLEFAEDDHGNTCDTATEVTCGSQTAVQTSPAGDIDYLELELTGPGLITVFSTGNQDTYGSIYRSDCITEITHDNDSGGGKNFSMEEALSAGTYYIATHHYNASKTGDYTLNITCSLSYTINASASNGGSITPPGTTVVAENGSLSYIITPDSGNTIADVVVDGVTSLGAVSSYTFSNVTANHTIEVTFNLPAGTCMDLSDIPLDVRRHGAPANIMFCLDDSGSMDWEVMTDSDDGQFRIGNTDYAYLFDMGDRIYKTGVRSHLISGSDKMYWKSQWTLINKMYYNPLVEYVKWPERADADPNMPWSSPRDNTYTINLSDTYYSFYAGAAEIVFDDQDASFIKAAHEVIIDYGDAGYSETPNPSNWNTAADASVNGGEFRYGTSPDTDYTATWTPTIPADGKYNVYAKWYADPSNSTSVPYTITHATGTDTVTVNQEENGGEWVFLGTYDFNLGTSGNAKIEYRVGDIATDNICADAVRFVNTDGWDWATDAQANDGQYYWTAKDGDFTAEWNLTVTAGDYNVYAMWKSDTTRSSSVPYTITHSGGTDTVNVDQKSNGGSWNLLGAYTFGSGTGQVSIDYTRTGVNDTVSADAIKLVPTSAATIDIKNAHYYVWSNIDNKPYLVIIDGGSISYYQVIDNDDDDVIEEGEMIQIVTPPDDIVTGKSYAVERQNFANWFQYYRKRDLLTRAAVGRVITQMQGVNIGFRGINEVLIQPVLKVKVGGIDNTSTLLASLFAYELDAQRAMTPLRIGLEEIGHYLDKDDGDDGGVGPSPIASEEEGGACQQNFVIVFTDGYYNGGPPHVGNADADNGVPYASDATNTLADVAMYFYENDLDDNLVNMVPPNEFDEATHQHMVTYGVTFGVTGTMDPDDFDLENGPYPTWPSPITQFNDKRFKIDDLWHTAINGRGIFLSASNPQELIDAFLAVMQNIEARIGSASSVSVNGDELYEKLSGDIRMFQSNYSSDGWTGDVKAYELDPVSGAVITSSYLWSAYDVMGLMDWNTRIIATFDGSSGVTFDFDSLTDPQKTYLDPDWTTLDTNARNLIDYLRGDPSNEQKNSGSFRNRFNVLGDIVHSSPLFEEEILYAGGNDGMLHAFDAADGSELFAYVPSLVFSNLKKLAETNYSHLYYVDMTPTSRNNVVVNGSSITMLVGGLGKGGKGYYALDITDADTIASEMDLAGRVMWEYPAGTDDDMGYTYGRTTIAETNSSVHPWVVVASNGYNSINSKAVLYILDVEDGSVIRK
ncbi:MAG: hypothetical protein HN929_13590, partial [Chloroflexi bacterium]|nr:hypothetical protein [Chloroflexota bacterium]